MYLSISNIWIYFLTCQSSLDIPDILDISCYHWYHWYLWYLLKSNEVSELPWYPRNPSLLLTYLLTHSVTDRVDSWDAHGPKKIYMDVWKHYLLHQQFDVKSKFFFKPNEVYKDKSKPKVVFYKLFEDYSPILPPTKFPLMRVH